MQASCYVLLIVFAYCIYWLYEKFFRLVYYGGKFEGPTAYPIIGNSYMFLNKTPTEYRRVVSAVCNKYKDNVRIWLGHKLMIILSNPEDIKTLLSGDTLNLTVKSDEYRFLKMCTGPGLITIDGKDWTSHSKVIIPAFNNTMIDNYYKLMPKEVDVFMKTMAENCDNGEFFDIHPYILRYSLDVLTVTCMGLNMNFQKGENQPYYNASHRLNKLIAERIFDVKLKYDFFFKLTERYQEHVRDTKLTHAMCDKIIIERREKLLSSNKPSRVFLDILLEGRIDGIPLTNEEIRGEVLTFLEAGHTTSAVTLSFFLYNIARNPHVQRKLFEELDSVCGDNNEQVSLETLKNLTYMELVLQETHRMFPPVPQIARKVIKEFKLGGKIIPKDANLVISQYCLGQRPELFYRPEEFIPERFIEKEYHYYSFLPFSAGQRHCIGHRFANMEIKLFLCKFLRVYEVEVDKDFEPEFVISIAIAPENGMRLRLKKRV